MLSIRIVDESAVLQRNLGDPQSRKEWLLELKTYTGITVNKTIVLPATQDLDSIMSSTSASGGGGVDNDDVPDLVATSAPGGGGIDDDVPNLVATSKEKRKFVKAKGASSKPKRSDENGDMPHLGAPKRRTHKGINGKMKKKGKRD